MLVGGRADAPEVNVLEANVTLSLLERELFAARILSVDLRNRIIEFDDVGGGSLRGGHVRDVAEDVTCSRKSQQRANRGAGRTENEPAWMEPKTI
jgi:hypothetical protein